MKGPNRIILFLILLTATVLRCYDLFNIPFTHDEFSALFRLRFDSFSELIEKGVKVDGHPAGVHVFLYYWTKLFGTSPWVIKLPFILFGILSSLLAYLVARKWFNETVGLICAAYLATIQFTVMYSQIGRPYISGLFFSLLMVYFWTKLIKDSDKKFFQNGLLFVLSATICAYNHHFSLLFAFIVGIAGVFIIPKNKRLIYIGFGAIIFILYLPHLSLFFHQLSVGGVGGEDGWLSVPTYKFLPHFIDYLFNYSFLAILIALSISMGGLVQNKFKISFKKRYILFSLFFFLPFLIGYYYSRIINPVLQFSMLIFSFTFFYFLLFGHLKEQKTKVNLLIVGTILIVNTFSLIWNRKHYTVFYNSVYEHVLTDHLEYSKDIPRIIESNPRFTEYFIENQSIDTNFYAFEKLKDIHQFRNLVEELSIGNDEIYFGAYSSDARTISIIRHYFPKIKNQKDYFLGSTYVFSKTTGEERKMISSLTFDEQPTKEWTFVEQNNIIDSATFSRQNAFCFDENLEYGLVYTTLLSEIIPHKKQLIDIEISVKSDVSLEEVYIVSEIKKDSLEIYWSASDFKDFQNPSTNTDDWNTIYHTIQISNARLNVPLDECELKVLLWNKAKKQFLVDDFNIHIRRENPILYGLFDKITVE